MQYLKHIAIICVGNLLMADDGLGIEVYKRLKERYIFPQNVSLFDCGCLSLSQINLVRDFDVLISIDALDNTGAAPGTVLRFSPSDVQGSFVRKQSLHDLRLADLFESACLLGYEAQGICLGMQVVQVYPDEFTIGLSAVVKKNLPALIDACLNELEQLGYVLELRGQS